MTFNDDLILIQEYLIWYLNEKQLCLMNDQIRKEMGSWLQSIGTNVNIPANQKMSLLCIECVKEERKNKVNNFSTVPLCLS